MHINLSVTDDIPKHDRHMTFLSVTDTCVRMVYDLLPHLCTQQQSQKLKPHPLIKPKWQNIASPHAK